MSSATDHLAEELISLCAADRRVTVFIDGMPPLRPETALLDEGTGCLRLTIAGQTTLVAVDRLVGVADEGAPGAAVGFSLG